MAAQLLGQGLDALDVGTETRLVFPHPSVRRTKRIVGAAATGETCHIIMKHDGKMPYWEGQSYGVIPPGLNPKNGKPNSVRLYSIASSRYGDDMTGTTTSLCVRRATYWCPELKADDPAKKGAPPLTALGRKTCRRLVIEISRAATGVCSNFLCDTKPGDEVVLTGPSGKVPPPRAMDLLCPPASATRVRRRLAGDAHS